MKVFILVLTTACFLAVQGDSVCFYTETNYQGSQLCEEGNVNLWPGSFNDQFKSVKVPPAKSVIMFVDDTFHGYGTVTDNNVPDLTSIGMSSKISSYIVPTTACFYTGINFGGTSRCYEGKIDLYREDYPMNDRFQSVKIPNVVQVVVFVDDAYHGYAILLTGDIADLGTKGVKNSISSLIVSPAI